MVDSENIFDKIKAACPEASPSASRRCNFTVMLLKSRDFPDGDDVCIRRLDCVAKIPKTGSCDSAIVITSDNKAFSVNILSETEDCIYTRTLQEIAL